MSMSSKGTRPTFGPPVALSLALCFSFATVLTPELPCSSVYAQVPTKVRSIGVDFVPEAGCPVEPTNIRCELDVDPFDAPMDARVYVDYKNNSDRPVAAVKFRLRFVDAQNRDRGTFHAVDMYAVPPQGVHGLKAKRDFTLHPAVIGVKARVLQVKYADGSDWVSAKMAELAQPGGAPAAAAGGGELSPEGAPALGAAPPQSAPPAYNPPPSAAANVYGSAPRANPREYENPPPQAGGAPIGQTYGSTPIGGGGAAIPPAAATGAAPQIDSFAGGGAAAYPPASAPPGGAAAAGYGAAASPGAAAYPPAAGYSPAGAAAVAGAAAGYPPAGAAGGAPGAAGYPPAGAAGGAPGAAGYPPAGAAGSTPGAAVGMPPGAAAPGAPGAPGAAPAAGAAAAPPPIKRYQGPQPVNTPYNPLDDK